MIKIFSKQLILLCGFLVISTSVVYSQVELGKLQVMPEDYIDFGELEAYSKTVPTENITIANCGTPESVLYWEVKVEDADPGDVNWLTVEGDTMGEINLEAGDSKYTDVSLGACTLCVDEAGPYEAAFYVNQYDCDQSDTACTPTLVDSVGPIKATMIIPDFNVLEVNPESLDFGENIEVKDLSITNAGQGEMEWEATSVIAEGVTWLTIDGETCTSGTTGGAETDTITVEVDRSVLEGCTYEHTASIKITASNALPDTVTIVVTVNKNITPPIPKIPTPVDGGADQSLYSTLSWQEEETSETAVGGGIVKYDVYFSSNQVLVDNENPSALICDDIAVPYCDPSGGGGQLNENTTYYWKVKAIDNCQGNTIDSEVWSFTTGEAPPSASNCLVSSLLSLSNNETTTLRRFRDEVLVGSNTGEKYIDLYYSYHTVEALLIMLFNPELRMCANRIVKESLPAIQAHLRGEIALVDTEIVEDMELFLEQFGKSASPGLKRVIRIMKKDIAKGDLFKDFGFSIVK